VAGETSSIYSDSAGGGLRLYDGAITNLDMSLTGSVGTGDLTIDGPCDQAGNWAWAVVRNPQPMATENATLLAAIAPSTHVVFRKLKFRGGTASRRLRDTDLLLDNLRLQGQLTYPID
jgi:hypothetical protein